MAPSWNNEQEFKDSLMEPLVIERFERLDQHRREFVMRQSWNTSVGTFRTLWASVLTTEQFALQMELERLRGHGVEPEKPFTPEHG